MKIKTLTLSNINVNEWRRMLDCCILYKLFTVQSSPSPRSSSLKSCFIRSRYDHLSTSSTVFIIIGSFYNERNGAEPTECMNSYCRESINQMHWKTPPTLGGPRIQSDSLIHVSSKKKFKRKGCCWKKCYHIT